MFGNQHGGAIDDLTKFWIPFAAIYTFILCLGMTIIYFQRFTQAVRIRGFWLTCAAVFSLHIYLLMIFLSYPLRFWYGCTSEFWVMATIFPFGLGLFQSKQHLHLPGSVIELFLTRPQSPTPASSITIRPSRTSLRDRTATRGPRLLAAFATHSAF